MVGLRRGRSYFIFFVWESRWCVICFGKPILSLFPQKEPTQGFRCVYSIVEVILRGKSEEVGKQNRGGKPVEAALWEVP